MRKLYFVAALLMLIVGSAHAQTTISNLPAASALSGSEAVPADQSGKTVKVTAAQILTYTQQSVVLPPGGRLTLTSGSPVMTADVLNATTVYYDTYSTNQVPVFNGTAWSYLTITGDELSDVISALTSSNLYDFFIGNNGVPTLCTGPAWSNSTAGSSSRGTGAGTTLLARLSGILTNAVSMTCKNGSSSFTCGINQCTWVGSTYAVANGQTSVNISTSASGGAGSIIGLCNAPNVEKRQTTQNIDSEGFYTYATNTWRNKATGVGNRITWVDCLGQASVIVTAKSDTTNGSGGAGGPSIGLLTNNQNTTPNTGSVAQWVAGNTVISAQFTMISRTKAGPLLGLNFVQEVEEGNGSNTNFSQNSQDTIWAEIPW